MEEPEPTLARSTAELELKQAVCASLFGLGSGERWDVDLEAGRIVFTNDDLVAGAAIQVVGTYNSGKRRGVLRRWRSISLRAPAPIAARPARQWRSWCSAM
jgi:hypothetical protein